MTFLNKWREFGCLNRMMSKMMMISSISVSTLLMSLRYLWQVPSMLLPTMLVRVIR